MVAKTTLRERNGPCGAIRRGLPCPCRGFVFERTVGTYSDCDCGHSQGIHAPGPPLPEIIPTCPTCGQILPKEIL